MMHAETVGRYEALVRWIHAPVWLLIISFVSFVRLYLHAGRPWLAWSICGLRTLVLILNSIDYSSRATVIACATYFWARLAHAIVYALGLPVFRTLAFTVGFLAQAVLALAIFKVL